MVLKMLIKIMFDTENKSNDNYFHMKMGVKMMEFILRELAKPILRRLGTTMASALLAFGYAADQVVAVETAVTGALLVIIDLILSNRSRKTK